MKKSKIVEKGSRGLFMAAAIISIIAVFAIFLFLLIKSSPAFAEIGVFKFIFGKEWLPKNNQYGILTMIVGSVVATVGAVAIGGTLGYFTAVYLAKFCPKRLKKPLSALINLLAGIPSVVYGFFGMRVITAENGLLGRFSPNGSGSGPLAVWLILGIMILPTIVALSKTAIEAVPESYYEGARALGASHERAIFGAVVPAARSGIFASFILGIGRAIGETMAVVMVAGGNTVFPKSLFSSFRTLTANVVMEQSYAEPGTVHMGALIATGSILLIFIFTINILLGLARRDKSKESNKRKLKITLPNLPFEKIGRILSLIMTAVSAFALLSIISFVLINGLPHINATLLFSSDASKTTILPSIVSTLMLIFLCMIIAIPVGIMAAIFLNEYTKRGSKFVKLIRSAFEILSGIPSIVYGLFGMILFCQMLNLGASIIAGALTVSIMILPTIVRSTEESLISVSDSYREGSLSLGAGKLRTIFKVVLPSALPGILSGVILSVGRIVSESAPLMFTMGASAKPMPKNFGSSGMVLAVALYKFSGEAITPEDMNNAYATACVLVVIVLALNLLSSFIVRRLQRGLGTMSNVSKKRRGRPLRH